MHRRYRIKFWGTVYSFNTNWNGAQFKVGYGCFRWSWQPGSINSWSLFNWTPINNLSGADNSRGTGDKLPKTEMGFSSEDVSTVLVALAPWLPEFTSTTTQMVQIQGQFQNRRFGYTTGRPPTTTGLALGQDYPTTSGIRWISASCYPQNKKWYTEATDYKTRNAAYSTWTAVLKHAGGEYVRATGYAIMFLK